MVNSPIEQSSVKRRYRIAILNSHPIQYFVPLYAYLNNDPEIEITALYCSDASMRGSPDVGFGRSIQWDIDMLAGYEAVFLGRSHKSRQPGGFFSLICPEVWGAITKGNYDALWIHGYAHAVNIIALAAAKTKGIPVFMRSETHLGLQRGGWRRVLRDAVLRRVYRSIDGFLAIGSGNASYYTSLGIPGDRIFNVPYTIDNERFTANSKVTADERKEALENIGLDPAHPVIVFASKFMRRKHPDHVLEAYIRVRQEGVQANLLLIGSGELDQELRNRVVQSNVDHVAFAGFANQSRLPSLLGLSDIFVLPSENEPWGLIVNEAMAAGLPVVVSEEIGCAADLVIDGYSGIKFPCGNLDALTRALRTLILDHGRRAELTRGAQQVIKGWSFEQCRIGVLQSLKSAL